jgi:hypothetical protein
MNAQFFLAYIAWFFHCLDAENYENVSGKLRNGILYVRIFYFFIKNRFQLNIKKVKVHVISPVTHCENSFQCLLEFLDMERKYAKAISYSLGQTFFFFQIYTLFRSTCFTCL